jgi:hypothetical protein
MVKVRPSKYVYVSFLLYTIDDEWPVEELDQVWDTEEAANRFCSRMNLATTLTEDTYIFKKIKVVS